MSGTGAAGAGGPGRRRRSGATIEQVAREAGVSRQTVSNALNAPERVRPETLDRVRAAIERLGYQPDQSARSLRTGERRTLAYLAPVDDPHDPNPLMGGFLEALVDAAGAAGYRVLLFRPRPGAADPTAAVEELIAARQVDGFVLADVLPDDPRVRHLAATGLPFVCFGRTGRGLPQGWVDIDNAAAMAAVAAHLAERGHRHVGYLGPVDDADLPWLAERRAGFRDAAGRHGLELAVEQTEEETHAGLAVRARALLRPSSSGGRRVTAIAAATDLCALAAYEAVRGERLAVGADVAVVGFHDLPLCRVLQPPLSSVRLPLRRIAAELVDGLLAQVRGGDVPAEGVLLPAELVVRASSGG
ncbi:LacI family DNA-binding transcriptional regulator [Streptacidiphilus jiangxiensis]|uniref:DNA-binding transcriptional regulator, LacI/PurR family n=1 Tax=Streptacidiphilus jiangxiensis TaxID=235985 RepID=A0A1H7RZQ3_STRJI|nr:LacI family DNA-binding transcriptional regulator [Streptacidiphilus jiangxiensis]SEL65801.1 DNA-binding transcriptional regulator, LacI/PurR family [Streptacidiphilus jiangxiensis]